ncbi:MAG: gliding motility protein GldC [Saprospiraceae bacterium]|nr:gliding motility protein GldC [Saprospiraceae bacterium]
MSSEEYLVTLKVGLDENKLPESLEWDATGADEVGNKGIKAFLLSMFDEETRETIKIDLWVKDFQVMEMDRFFYQTFRAMCDTYQKSTQNNELANVMREFTQYFGEKTGIIVKPQE